MLPVSSWLIGVLEILCTSGVTSKGKVKGEVIPLHAMEALGWRGGMAPTLSSLRHQKEMSGQHHAAATLYPWGKYPRYLLHKVPELVKMQRLEEKPSASVRDQTLVIQSIVRHCTD
jgi:hypothetical protein